MVQVTRAEETHLCGLTEDMPVQSRAEQSFIHYRKEKLWTVVGASPYSTVQTQRNQAELSSSGVISWQMPQLCWAWAGALSDSRGMEQSQLSTKAQNPARTISLEMLDYMSLSQDTSEGSFESKFVFPPVSFIA